MTTFEVAAGGPLRGTLRAPGDKSISHRALLFAALAEGTSSIGGLSEGEDVVRTRRAIQAMGAEVVPAESGWTIAGGRSRLTEAETVIDLGNSGTGMRLMAGWCASLPFLTVLCGDQSLHRRPMGRVIEPLRQMGADIDGRSGGSLPPLAIRGAQLKGIRYEAPVASAQLKSAVLIAGLGAEGETVVHEPVPTRTHTEEMLTAAGADISVDEGSDGSATITMRPSQLRAVDIDVPGDPSQGAFWMVAAAVVPGSDVTIEHLYVGPGRAGLIDVLVRMGADIELEYHNATTADVRVRYSALHGVDVSGDDIPGVIDELPILAVAAAMADGTTVVAEAEELRVKESDRIAAVVSELGGLGVYVQERPDGFIVQGRADAALSGGHVDAHLDHRIAMTGAIAGLLSATPTVVHGWESVATSYPTFAEDLARLRT